MCGIVGYIGKRDVAPLLLEGLQRLEYRGYDSAGIALHAGGKTGGLKSAKAKGRVRELESRLPKRFNGTPASPTPAGPPTARRTTSTPTPTSTPRRRWPSSTTASSTTPPSCAPA